MGEMVIAIKGLQVGKAPGGEGIPAEVCQYGVANLSNRLHRWIAKIWEEDNVSQSWKDDSIVITPRKGHRARSTLYIVFVDFPKTFDAVGRTGL